MELRAKRRWNYSTSTVNLFVFWRPSYGKPRRHRILLNLVFVHCTRGSGAPCRRPCKSLLSPHCRRLTRPFLVIDNMWRDPAHRSWPSRSTQFVTTCLCYLPTYHLPSGKPLISSQLQDAWQPAMRRNLPLSLTASREVNAIPGAQTTGALARGQFPDSQVRNIPLGIMSKQW